MKFRKVQVTEVDAIQYTGENLEEVLAYLGGPLWSPTTYTDKKGVNIRGVAGIVFPSDWIVRDVTRSDHYWYVWRDSKFKEVWERVEE